MSACTVAKRTQKALRYGFCEHVYWPVGRTCSAFVFQLVRVDAKSTVLWGKVSK